VEKDKKIVKGWKCFNKDLCCEPTSDVCFEFEVGKTYSVDGKLEMCKNGFHFHTNTKDLFEYYNFYNKPRVCEIEAINVIIENNKSVCKTIKIIKELTWDEVLSLVNSGDYNSGYRNSGYYNSGYYNSGGHNSGDYNSGDYNSGYYNSGYYNSGYYNSGGHNSGYYNSGDHNSGDYNSGYRNSGGHNSGYYNSGGHNSGYYNSGDHNSGDRNSGDYNSGYRNSGYWNSCNKESGFFNSRISEEIRIFNKPCLCKIWESCIKPSFIYFGLDRWISSERMSPKEKKEYPDYIITDGYLKELDYKEAWLESAKSAMDRSDWDKQLKLLQGLPNFDWDVFEEISGLSKEFLTEK